jgi:hypothetical protein
MRAWRTPWANTLRSTGLIFIHDYVKSKLSQVAGYVIGAAARDCHYGRLVFKQEIFLARGPATAAAGWQ